MSPTYTYLLVDFFCIVFPFIFSFHPKFEFKKEWKYFVLPCLLVALLFVVWDEFFVRLNVWNFNPYRVLSLRFGHLPIEEILFFICIPYACVFTYYCVKRYIPTSATKLKIAKSIFLALSISLLIIGITHLNHLYTSVTFISLAILLVILYLRYSAFLFHFLISYLLILLPFFISNGILTGSFIGEAVVVYNNDENLNIRIATIPIEDMFYGMLLLILNVLGYELQLAKKR